MLYGLYLSAQGANAQATRLDAVGNNIANAGTNGFKRQLAVFQERRPAADEYGVDPNDVPDHLAQMTGGIGPGKIVTDYTDGPLLSTGGRYDVAITGKGFLRLSDGTQEYLTRDGKLGVTATGELIHRETGMKVLGAEGNRVQLTLGAGELEIAADGSLYQVTSDGARLTAGKLGVVEPGDFADLETRGHGLYRANSAVAPAKDAVVRQGYVEGSSASSVVEMLAMIEASRGFEMNMNMMKIQDESLGRLLQSISRR